MTTSNIPNLRVVVWFCIVAVFGYAIFSVYAVMILRDATMTGDVIGTWKSFAMLVFGFWIGSSSGGKEKKDAPTGELHDPVNTREQENRDEPEV